MRIQVELAQSSELIHFAEMESEQENARYIVPSSLSHHQEQFARDDLFYLSVKCEEVLIGFVLIAKNSGSSAAELRRIIIAEKGCGYGQQAMLLTEGFCKKELGVTRIWLDVYGDNLRGQHIYKKMGYQPFSSKTLHRRELILMEKAL